MSDTEDVHTPEEIQRNVSNEVILEYLLDQKHDRRWKVIRRVFVSLAILTGVLLYTSTLAGSLGYRLLPTKDTVAVVPISGVIANNTEASADSVITILKKLFDTDKVKGIVLLIDSGGGSPTEAERITRYIDSEQERTGKPVIASCASMCASAAYMIAAHTDKIYAGRYTWAGSIGAIMKGWNFKSVMETLKVDQRVFASGPLKDLMNPYRPMSEAMEAKLGKLVNNTADTFIAEILSLRGDSLSNDEDLFTGAVWIGNEALRLGLVDEIGTLESVVSTEFPGMNSETYRPKKRGNTLFDSVLGNISTDLMQTFLHAQYEVRM